MKHSKITRVAILTIVCLLVAAQANDKVEAKVESKCEDACQACQRVVYQMKFQGIADCEVNGVCRDTCYKIREAWGTPFNPFEPFLKDMFGKCEICFRAGHCTISQCKDQERNEIEVINRIINTSHLTAKISPEVLVSFPDAPDAKALPKVVKLNHQVEQILSKDLKTAMNIKTAEHVVPKVQNLVQHYFDAPQSAVKGSAQQILNFGKPQPQSSAQITYWGDNKGTKQVASTQKVVQKLNNHLNEIQKLQQSAKGKDGKSLAKVVRKEQKELNKLVRKVNKLNHKLVKKEKTLQRIASSTAVQDPNVKVAVNNSINQVKEYAAAVQNVKKQLKEDKSKLSTHKKKKTKH